MVKAVTPIPFVRARFFDRCGKPLAGGKVYSYAANTTTEKVTYKDPYGLTPNTNPIILDAAGEADIYLDGTYRIRITDRNDVLVNDVAKIGSWFSDNLQDTLDNISGAMDDALKPVLQNLDEVINAAAAAGAGANGWTDMAIAVLENVNQRQINDGLDSITQLLAIKNPRSGMRVYVKSYYSGLNKGGGLFVYDSAKASENNNVTIIKGWVRDLSSKVLTTDDAGLVTDNTDKTARLQQIADVLSDTSDMTFIIVGKHLVSSNIIFNNAVGIKIKAQSDGELSAKELRDNWVFKAGVRGVIHLRNCPYATVYDGLKLTGSKQHNLNANEPWEDGDSGISLHTSPHTLIERCTISNTVAWGILAENSQYVIVQQSDISDVVRQSGINIVVGGGGYCKVLHNRIKNVGLYGIEWETRTDSFGNESTGNTIENAHKGQVAVNNIISLTSSSNVFKNCREGVTLYPLKRGTQKILISGDVFLGCQYGAVNQSTENVSIIGNTFDCTIHDDYTFRDSYSSILEIVSSNSFLVLDKSGLKVGQVKINNMIYTIDSISSVQNNKYKTGTLKLVTLSSNLAADVKQHDFIKVPFDTSNNNRGIHSGGDSLNFVAKGNVIKSYYSALQSDSAYAAGSAINELFDQNTVIDCAYWARVPLQSYGVQFSNTQRIRSDGIVMSNSILSRALTTKERITLSNTTAKQSGSPNPILTFYVDEPRTIKGVVINFLNSSTSGIVVVKLDNVNTYTLPSLSSPVAYGLSALNAGTHSVQVVDTVGDLTYTSFTIDLLLC